MKLISFTVKNFRSITKASTVPMSGLTVLIGPNNEGKSNILRGLVLSMQVVLGYRIHRGLPHSPYDDDYASYDWERDFPIGLQDSESNGVSEFLLEFDLNQAECKAFFEEVGSRVKSPLPIEIRIGRDGPPAISVRKRGPGSAKVTKKATQISAFLAQRIDLSYIPAVRTAESAHNVVEQMVSRGLSPLESDQNYIAALNKVAELQQPLLNALAKTLHETLKQFLPSVRSVEIEIPKARRTAALRRVEIYVDDGAMTQLRYKGDGIQSLAALALMRRQGEAATSGKELLLVVEEPESHLHPGSISELRVILQQIAEKQQVLLSTHSPLFVDRADPSRNVLVKEGKADPARSIEQVREILGVRAADNLRTAELVLVLEGEDDRLAVGPLLSHYSTPLREALRSNLLAIDAIGGAGNLSYKLGLLRNEICEYFVFLDGDSAGKGAIHQAKDQGLLTEAHYALASLIHLGETEFEDLLDDDLLSDLLFDRFAVKWQDLPKKRKKRKWSDRASEVFRLAGKQFDEVAVKNTIANWVAENPDVALRQSTRAVFDNLVAVLEAKFTQAHSK